MQRWSGSLNWKSINTFLDSNPRKKSRKILQVDRIIKKIKIKILAYTEVREHQFQLATIPQQMKLATVRFELSLMAVVLLLTPSSSIAADRSSGTKGNLQHVNGVVGAIVDTSSRVGKEERVAMEIAREDLYRYSNQTLILHVKDTDQRKPIRAALAGTFVLSLYLLILNRN